jgi:hypothetical protein
MRSNIERLGVALVALGLLVLPIFISAAYAGGIDQFQSLAQPDYSGGAPGAPQPQVKAPVLSKFFANASINGSISSGVCPGLDQYMMASYCAGSPGNCVAFTVNGTGAASTPFTKTSVSGCMTFENYSTDDADLCFRGVGNATLSSSGASIVFALAGETCFAQLHTTSVPTSLRLVTSGTYTAEGGTGAYANAIGSGDFAFTQLTSPITAIPYTGPGQFSMTGNIAK